MKSVLGMDQIKRIAELRRDLDFLVKRQADLEPDEFQAFRTFVSRQARTIAAELCAENPKKELKQ